MRNLLPLFGITGELCLLLNVIICFFSFVQNKIIRPCLNANMPR